MTIRKGDETLAANLFFLRSLKGWSEAELARRADVDPKTVNNIANRKGPVRSDMIEKLAVLFGLKTWMLLSPQLPIMYKHGGELEDLLNDFLSASDEGRYIIRHVAKSESLRQTQPDSPRRFPALPNKKNSE